jgi:hypothetical protein
MRVHYGTGSGSGSLIDEKRSSPWALYLYMGFGGDLFCRIVVYIPRSYTYTYRFSVWSTPFHG